MSMNMFAAKSTFYFSTIYTFTVNVLAVRSVSIERQQIILFAHKFI